jgi:hypothetical protein
MHAKTDVTARYLVPQVLGPKLFVAVLRRARVSWRYQASKPEVANA